MRKIIAYIAQSADGKIARPDGSVDWLDAIPNPDKTDYGYARFYDTIDTTVMGNSTFRKVLDFDIPFPYAGKKNYVLTRADNPDPNPHVTFTKGDETIFHKLKARPGKNIWLVGGSKTNTWFLQHELIDEMFLFTMPVLIGQGIPLFEDFDHTVYLNSVSTKSFTSGVILIHYRVDNQSFRKGL